MNSKLENNLLKIEVSDFGAELQSIKSVKTGYEFLWQGNPRFWKRRSPVLFPIVGSVWAGRFFMDGKEYPMSQHGFARDMVFTLVDTEADNELWYELNSTEETLRKYPRNFRLRIGYRLDGERITVIWKVKNNDNKEMAFQIGAHPAFNLPDFSPADKVKGYLAFDTRYLESEIIQEKGCFGKRTKQLTLDDESMLPIEEDTFSEDALVFGKGAVHRASLLTKDRRPVLSMFFQTPYLGVWAPSADAPFVCIEPWYGRADIVNFTGDFSERPAVNRLAPGETFTGSYLIAIDTIL